jgi:predicted transcriptional regulator
LQLSDVERKILQCFKNVEPNDLSINEVAKLAGINRITATKYIEVLCARGILVHTRRIGRAKMFKIAPEHERAKEITELKEEKPMIKVKKVQFIRPYLQYKPGQTATLEEGWALELIKKGYAQEQET